MNFKKVFLVACLSVVMFSATAWANPPEFNIKVNSGDKYSIHVVKDEDTRITLNSGETKTNETLDLDMNIYIEEIDKYKNLEIGCEYKSIRLSKEIFGNKIEYNTENKDINNPLNNMYKEFIGKRFTLNLNNKGKILSIKGVNELLTSIADKIGTNKEEKLFIKEDLNKKFGEETINEVIKKSISYYPEKNIEVGETWQSKYDLKEIFPISCANNFKLLYEKDGILNIDMMSTLVSNTENNPINIMGTRTNVNMKGTSKGIIEIEKGTGMPKNLNFNRVMDGYLESESNSNMGEKVITPIKISEKLTYEFIKK